MSLPKKNAGSRIINPQTHFKRLGRELAMQYLYLKDMSPESETQEESEQAREMFWATWLRAECFLL